jgi:Raf kinase inhibitor-like YbhB/YbcL family protein
MGCTSSVTSPELYLPQQRANISGQVIMRVSSESISSEGIFGKQFSCDNKEGGYSPSVGWDAVDNAQSYVLIVEDPDAPAPHAPFIHWIVFNIPRTITELKEHAQLLGIGGIEGKNSAEKIGYYPFCPPHGSHRYYFKVYALDKQLDLPTGAGKKEIEAAMQDHILGYGELMGRYSKAQK